MISRIKNESGFTTIIAVIMVSLLLVTSLTAIYIYQVNNTRYQARVKEAYKLIGVMEEASKTVRAAWDKAAANVLAQDNAKLPPMQEFQPLCDGSVSCGGPAVNNIDYFNTRVAQDMASIYLIDTSGTGNLCIPNPDNSADVTTYCFKVGKSQAKLDFEMINPQSPIQGSRVQSFVAKLERFFDDRMRAGIFDPAAPKLSFSRPTMIGWMLAESRALAQFSGGGADDGSDDGGGSGPGYPGGGGTGGCPPGYKLMMDGSCVKLAGATPTATATATASATATCEPGSDGQCHTPTATATATATTSPSATSSGCPAGQYIGSDGQCHNPTATNTPFWTPSPTATSEGCPVGSYVGSDGLCHNPTATTSPFLTPSPTATVAGGCADGGTDCNGPTTCQTGYHLVGGNTTGGSTGGSGDGPAGDPGECVPDAQHNKVKMNIPACVAGGNTVITGGSADGTGGPGGSGGVATIYVPSPCQTCGNGTGAACGALYAKPAIFGGGIAVAQQFMLVPLGYKR